MKRTKKIIKQTVNFNAYVHTIYELLMDSTLHAAFTGEPARISRRIGGLFSAYDGYCSGKTTELILDQKIVQLWRASDWPTDVYSTVVYELMPSAKGTRLVFTQSGVPQEFAASIAEGWKEFYWDKIKSYIDRR
jgi:activator of HSP90 ATPase